MTTNINKYPMLVCGDCLDKMKNIPNNSIDLVVCDLPYGMTKCEWDKNIDISSLWNEYDRVSKDNAAIILFAKQPFTTDLINSNRDMFRYSITWIKNIANGYLNAKIKPLEVTEDILVFYKRKPTYNPQMEGGYERKVSKVSSKRKCKSSEVYNKAICVQDYDSTERYPINVVYFESDKHRNCLHPTQKPEALLRYLILTFSNAGDVVLDNCMGSGTAGVASIDLERHFIGIELNEHYFNVAKTRIQSKMTI